MISQSRMMGLVTYFTLGRTTKRYLTNVMMLVGIFGILYWDSKQESAHEHWESDLMAEKSEKLKAMDDGSDVISDLSQHTTSTSDGSQTTQVPGVFNFLGNLWKRDDSSQSREENNRVEQENSTRMFSLTVTNDNINRFRVDLPPLIKNYKNPCWIEELPVNYDYEDSYYSKCITQRKHKTVRKRGHHFEAFASYLANRTRDTGQRWRIRCFPYFFLLGVSKSGTTDFFAILKEFVNDFVPGFYKELHFWEWKRCQIRDMCEPGVRKYPTFGEYLDTFDAASEVIRRTMVRLRDNSSYHPLVIGDFSPSTLNFNPCWQDMPGNEHLLEPRYTTAHYLYAIRPQTRFIVMLRDPVERLYSNYRMHFRLTNTPLEGAETFHKEATACVRVLEKCFRENTHRACIYRDMRFGFKSYVVRSLYEVFLQDWFNLFPHQQFLVIKMEDYTKSRVPYIKKTIQFLGLTPMTPEQQWQIENREVANQDKSHSSSDMLPQTRAFLRRFFRPWNHRLAKLLDDDSFTWDY